MINYLPKPEKYVVIVFVDSSDYFSANFIQKIKYFIKKLLILLFIALGMTTVKASPFNKTDEETLVKLIDSLSAALVKQDKAWLAANLTEDCNLTDPMGQVLAKSDLIAEGVY